MGTIMPLDFPSNPTNGQIYGNYYYDASVASWRSNPLVSGSAFISDNVPSVSPTGSIWYNSTDGTLFVRYGNQWVEARSNPKIIPGSIVQVVQGVLADPVVFTTANAWTSVGISASITPKFINSKIMVSIHIGIGTNSTSQSYDAAFGLFRNNVQIALPNGPYGVRTPSILPFGDRASGTNEMTTVSNQYLDSPASLSQLTYDVRAFSSNSYTHFINRTGADADQNYDNRMISTITLMEVAQ